MPPLTHVIGGEMSDQTQLDLNGLAIKANEIRQDIIRMVGAAGSGHPGGALSAADLVAALYFNVMRHDPKNPKWPDRDRFILSKGHACPVLYSALARSGYIPVDILCTLRKLGSILQGHPDMNKVPGVEFGAGSLGQGFPGAVGMALAGKLDKKDYHVFVMLGDGEIQEGSVWEASMSASHYKLDNLIAILDFNGLQIDGPNSDVMTVEPVTDKWRAFGWNVVEIDGHNLGQIIDTFETAKNNVGRPTMVIAHTIKGKGVDFMENNADWHGKAPNADEVASALQSLSIKSCG
jgi:transketolase